MLTAKLITGRLERYYHAKANAEARSFPIRGSGLGKCGREISSLLAKRPTLPFTYKSGRTFEDGHDRGRAIAQALQGGAPPERRANIRLEHEVWTTIPGIKNPQRVIAAVGLMWPGAPIRMVHERNKAHDDERDFLQVRGRADFVEFSDDGRFADLLDVKGKNSFGMKKVPEEGVGREYQVQVLTYAAGLAEQGVTLRSAHVLFENKDTQEWLPIAVDLSDRTELELALAEIASTLNAFADPERFTGDEGTPLFGPDHRGKLGWRCNYCAVGPRVGNCAPGRTLNDARKAGALMPAWEVL